MIRETFVDYYYDEYSDMEWEAEYKQEQGAMRGNKDDRWNIEQALLLQQQRVEGAKKKHEILIKQNKKLKSHFKRLRDLLDYNNATVVRDRKTNDIYNDTTWNY